MAKDPRRRSNRVTGSNSSPYARNGRDRIEGRQASGTAAVQAAHVISSTPHGIFHTPSRRQEAIDDVNRRWSNRLRVSIDFGTGFFAMSYSHIKVAHDEDDDDVVDSIVSIDDIRQITFIADGKTTEIANICAYFSDPVNPRHSFADGSTATSQTGAPYLHFEPAVTEALGRRIITADDVFKLVKIALCERADPDVMAISDRIRILAATLPQRVDAVTGQLRDCTAIDIVSDILKELWGQGRQQIEARLDSFDESFGDWRSWPIDFILCVPSTWSDEENQKMISAAEPALLTRSTDSARTESKNTIELVHEPTAAAAYVLAKNGGRVGSGIRSKTHMHKVNDVMLMVDIGCGTADLIIYSIEKLSPLTLREEIPGSGACCGSGLVNEIFNNRVQQKLKKAFSKIERRGFNREQILERLNISFESKKKEFKESEGDREWFLACQGMEAYEDRNLTVEGYRIINEGLLVAQDEMIKCFRPCIAKIECLIRNQLEAYRNKTNDDPAQQVQTLMLLGGFSMNEYLRQSLESTFGSWVKIVRPEFKLTNVVSDGGLLAGGNRALIRLRIPQCSYGYAQDVPYDRRLHGDEYDAEKHGRTQPPGTVLVFESPFDGHRFVQRRIKWAIVRGKQYKQMESHSLDGSRALFPVDGSEIFIREPLFMSRTISADHAEIDSQNNDIREISTIEAKMQNPKQYGYDKKQAEDGSSYYEVDYRVITHLEGLRLSWEMYIPPKGRFKNEGKAQYVPTFSMKGSYHINAAFALGTG